MRLSPPVLASLAFLSLASASEAQTIFVDADLTTGSGDGTSWANAFQGENGLHSALNSGLLFTDIYVAGGRYRTHTGSARGVSFDLVGEVKLFGGFAGGETDPDQRPPFGSNPSILTGDLLDNDVIGAPTTLADNAYHVVRAAGQGTVAELDGFTIQGGNANGFTSFRNDGGGIFVEDAAQLTVRNCRLEQLHARRFGGGVHGLSGTLHLLDTHFEGCTAGDRGGAVSATFGPELRLERCVIKDCRASGGGGLAMVETEDTLVTDTVFVDNHATGASSGGGLYLAGAVRVHITGCTIAENESTFPNISAVGIHVAGPWTTVRNSILWGNEGAGGGSTSAYQITNGVDVEYCIVEGGFVGTGCSGADPLFVDLPNRDLRLTASSPAIDAGHPDAIASHHVRADVEHRRREVDDPSTPNAAPGFAPHPDLGAYERSSTIGSVVCWTNASAFGRPAILDATGSVRVVDQDLTLTARLLPINAFGFFLASRASSFVRNPGISFGNLCLGGAIGRFLGPGQIMNSGPMGVIQLDVPLGAIPTPAGLVATTAGESWFFQAWFRESATGAPASNFTDAVRIRFE
ncbi:right-handed parallel beta-helix repeat-containing protein [Saltatorellus ferox]